MRDRKRLWARRVSCAWGDVRDQMGEAMRGTLFEVKEKGGVAGVVQADSGVKDLVRQILERVEDESTSGGLPGENAGSPEVVLAVRVDGMRYTLTRSPPPDQPEVNLSPRETEVVRLVAKGLPNKAIAAVLDISPWTVATHLRRVFGKLGVSCRAEMVARVLEDGLLEGSL